MTDDINRFVEMAAVLDDAVASRERVIAAQQAEIVKLNQIVAILIDKVEWFSALVAGLPPPVRPYVAPVVTPAAAPTVSQAICAVCRHPFYVTRGWRNICRTCRGQRVQAGIAKGQPIEEPHVH